MKQAIAIKARSAAYTAAKQLHDFIATHDEETGLIRQPSFKKRKTF